jgi:hypothetical protein
MLTKRYCHATKNMIFSEALLTLSCNASVEANSAPTLHLKDHLVRTGRGVGALFAAGSSLVAPLATQLRAATDAAMKAKQRYVHRFAAPLSLIR